MSAAICRQKVTVQALIPFDRITPMGNGLTPRIGNASEFDNGFADATSETNCRFSVSWNAVADKVFSTAPSLIA